MVTTKNAFNLIPPSPPPPLPSPAAAGKKKAPSIDLSLVFARTKPATDFLIILARSLSNELITLTPASFY